MYPPTPPTGEKGSIFYNLLRPEFVGRYHKPLSSDSFSKFGHNQSIVHNAEVQEAFEILINYTIPKAIKLPKCVFLFFKACSVVRQVFRSNSRLSVKNYQFDA